MMSIIGAVFFGILPCFLYFEAFLGSVSGFGVGFFRILPYYCILEAFFKEILYVVSFGISTAIREILFL